MKKKMFVLALLAGITMFSMHGAEAKKAEDSAGTPSYAVKAYYTSMAKADFAAAKKYLAAKELIQMTTALEEMAKEDQELIDDTKKEFANSAKAKFISETITGDKAVVVFSYQENGKTRKETHNLKKVNGVWLIED